MAKIIVDHHNINRINATNTKEATPCFVFNVRKPQKTPDAPSEAKDVFGAGHINDLPISFDIGWYEQKAVAVLLALLHLGIKGIRLGPTLPA